MPMPVPLIQLLTLVLFKLTSFPSSCARISSYKKNVCLYNYQHFQIYFITCFKMSGQDFSPNWQFQNFNYFDLSWYQYYLNHITNTHHHQLLSALAILLLFRLSHSETVSEMNTPFTHPPHSVVTVQPLALSWRLSANRSESRLTGPNRPLRNPSRNLVAAKAKSGYSVQPEPSFTLFRFNILFIAMAAWKKSKY